jgi:hypothetical protein
MIVSRSQVNYHLEQFVSFVEFQIFGEIVGIELLVGSGH